MPHSICVYLLLCVTQNNRNPFVEYVVKSFIACEKEATLEIMMIFLNFEFFCVRRNGVYEKYKLLSVLFSRWSSQIDKCCDEVTREKTKRRGSQTWNPNEWKTASTLSDHRIAYVSSNTNGKITMMTMTKNDGLLLFNEHRAIISFQLYCDLYIVQNIFVVSFWALNTN